MAEKQQHCILCGEEFYGWGNNPEPIVPFECGKACDTCNDTKVIPMRLMRFKR